MPVRLVAVYAKKRHMLRSLAPRVIPFLFVGPGSYERTNNMEYLIGVILALGAAGFATLIGLDRGRAFYSTVLIVIAS
jgi:hypothetical protein